MTPSTPAPVVSLSTVDQARTDRELVDGVMDGNQRAGEQLFRRYAPGLLVHLTRLLGNRADAQDIAQDAFTRAFTRIDSLDDADAFGAWLRQIATRLALMKLRRRRLERVLGLARAEPDATLETLASLDATPEQVVELKWIDEMLWRVSPSVRASWILRRVEGHQLQDIARELDCSLATVKRRIKRADERIERHVRERRSS